MSTLTVNGKRVAKSSITFPYYGAWSADVHMSVGDSLSGSASFVVGDLTLTGKVVRSGTFTADTSARIVGGAAGWPTVLPAKGYSHTAGVKLSTVLGDAARAVGETISVATDRTIGTHWTRTEAKARDVLALLVGDRWWVDAAGVTQTGPRSGAPIVTPFTVISRDPARGSFVIASESIAPWQPGRTFSCNTVPDVQTISSVTIESGNDGKLRIVVLAVDEARDRLRSSVRDLVRAELSSLLFFGVWEYTIRGSSGSSTVDVVPSDSRMPSLAKVSMAPGLMGEVVTPLVGSKCRIRFVNGDPSRPECIGIVGAQTLARIGGGADFVALAASVATQLSNLKSAIAAAAVVAGDGGASFKAAIITSLSAWPGSVAATKVKVT